MAYIGTRPAVTAMTSDNIASGAITADHIAAGAITAADVAADMATQAELDARVEVPLKGITHSDGSSSASGSDVNMLSLALDLTGYENYILWGWGHTAISENNNTSNTSRIRLKLHEGSAGNVYFAAARQGIGAYSTVTWSSNSTAHISCQGYFVVTAAYAKSCVLYLNGGIDGTDFSWGDQNAYTNFDGETPNAGATLGYLLLHP